MLDRAAAGRTDLRVLDCGCGTGYNLQQLARYGATFGIDLVVDGLAIAKRAAPPLARADVTRLPFASGGFDLVTSFDVLQCVPGDRQAVREIARVLKTGGYFVGTVAALRILHGDHSILSGEVRRYTRGSLRKLLHSGGLQPVVTRYAFASLFPIMLGLRALQRLRGARAAGREITMPPAPINVALTALVLGDAALTRWFSPPFGSSILFLARKA